ncbi:eukaryotic translation initiation factor 4 gamma 2-like, partial [Ruditapes philippinarum]|uniref:eukaryotic translation initiation factor 4 gamma 2-like n=1 Tax=Ruditapes philippinarum TaxID=129788 RepID=UPI00295B8E66
CNQIGTTIFVVCFLLYHKYPQKKYQTGNILDGKQNLGGTSPHAGGRDERSVSSPSTAQRWIPPSSVKRDVLTHDEKHDSVFRKVRGILNKLSPEKFDKLSLELLNVGIESQVILKGIILLIFEKALDEPKYSSVYAKLCHQLCEDAPNFEPKDSNISQGGWGGELGKLEMLHEGILHRCIKQLLEKKKNLPIQESAEDLECLCQIMTTVGRRLDTPKAKAWMDQYFSRIKQFSGIPELPSRIRFMLQDVIELRDNKWKNRHTGWEGPKTITQIRQEAADETGVYIPQQNRTGGPRPPTQMNGSLGAPWKPGVAPTGPTGSFGDFFGMPPTGIMGGLGTGPGVIQMDGYIPNYNNKTRNNQHNPGYNNYQKRPPPTDGGGGGSPRSQRHNFQNQQQQGGRLSPQQQGQQQQGSPVGQQQFQQKKPSVGNLPPRLAKLQQQQLQQQQQAPPPPSQQQAMMMVQDGQMPIPLPNTAVPPPPLPKHEEISLRPNRNFTTALRPSVPTMLPKSAQAAPSSGSPLMTGNSSMMDQRVNNLNPLLAKQAAVTIKEVPKEKLNPPKKKSPQPNKDEIKKTVKSTLDDYLEGGSLQESLTTIKELNPPKKFMPEMLTDMMISTVDKSDTDRENVMKLVVALKSENLITSSHFMDGYRSVLEQMAGMESDVPLIKTYVARFGAFGVTESIVTLQELAEPMEQGTYYPLFLLCLQQMLKQKDKDWVVNVFNESKMDLQNMLPEVDRSKERMMEILEERGLSFMFPLLRVQSELWKQIQAEPSATALFKWIKETVSTDLHHTPAFINVLTTSVLRYVTSESTLGEGCDPKSNPSKTLQEKEKQLLDEMKDVVQKFVQENTGLQMHSLYAAQVFCYNNNYPKGMMLRLFMDLYDMEVVDEEVFLKWKEEVNDEYPGKGKALFQVNNWLTWLEQAEVESDEEED